MSETGRAVNEPTQLRTRIAQITSGRPVEVLAPDLFRTERMQLRPLREGDRDEFIRAVSRSRKELDRFSTLHRDGETDDVLFARQLELTREAERKRSAVRRFGFFDDGSLVGAFHVNAITRGLEWTGQMNWWVTRDMVGRGLATEGVGAMVEHALDPLPTGLGLHTVVAWIQRDNLASVRIAEKLGFARGGEDQSYIQTGSRWALHDLYRRTVSGA